METNKNVIPADNVGKNNDLKATTVLSSHELAVEKFRQAKARMLNPSIWHKITTGLGGKFQLVDDKGNPVERNAVEGDYLKIDLPGPGPATGSGYDWVEVELIEKRRDGNEEQCSMRLRPASPPFDKEGPTAHFFKDSASSTFIVRCIGNVVVSSYHGRNEQLNVATGKVVDNLRNAAVGIGAMAGLSEAQWYALIKAFLSE
jgi:hypothetical protein